MVGSGELSPIFTDPLYGGLRHRGVMVKTYHDNVSHSQNENLNRITDFHNAQICRISISVHFNAYVGIGNLRSIQITLRHTKMHGNGFQRSCHSERVYRSWCWERTGLHFPGRLCNARYSPRSCFVGAAELSCESLSY